MKLIPGPLLVPSLAIGVGAMAIQAAAAPHDATLVAIAAIGALGSLGAAWLAHKGRELGRETKIIAEQTRSMADGRLTDMTKQVNELTSKLATAEGTNAKLIAEEVGKASESLIARAQGAAVTVTSVAEAAADALLRRAEERATGIVADAKVAAQRLQDEPRRRRR